MTSVWIVIAKYDDWHGLYVNGELYTEDHSIGARDVLEVLEGKTLGNYQIMEVDNDWWADQGNFPQKLEDVHFIS